MQEDQELQELLSRFARDLDAVTARPAFEQVKAGLLGRQGAFASLMKRLSTLPPEERKTFGQKINEAKQRAEAAAAAASERLQQAELEAVRRASAVEVDLPGRPRPLGDRHPITLVRREVSAFFEKRGFTVVDGPELETEEMNFDALNIPADHPARESQDSFFLAPGHLLRTQTSPVQIRAMRAAPPPHAVLSPGRVYRRDTLDATHSFVFHQIEGLLVDRGVTFADLKGLLTDFLRDFFGADAPVRFRPDFFPFTEPSCEASVGFGTLPDGSVRWLEVLGGGLVHPRVLRAGGADPEEFSGIAFGMGIERLAMIRYGIQDIRLFWQNDVRFLASFR